MNGLRTKSLYPEFRTFLSNYNIVSCAESACDENLQIPGYHLFHKTRTNCKRTSGGLSAIIKSEIADHVTCVHTDSPFVLWLKVDKSILNKQNNLVIGTVYIPPEGSPYSSRDAFDEVQQEIIDHFHEEKSILLIVLC